MAKKKELNLSLPAVDELFTTEEQRQELELEKVVNKELFTDGYPTRVEKIAKMFEDKQSLDYIVKMVEQFSSAYENDKSLMRFHYHNPKKLLERLKVLQQEPVVFESQGQFLQPELFISEDEIDHLLIQRGSGVSEGKFRIFSHYLNDHTEQEYIAFLKREYGTGGVVTQKYNEDHSTKGIVFSRGKLMKPYDKVALGWKQVSRRLKELIQSGRYMSERELAYLPEYEIRVLASEVYHFYYNQPEDVVRPYAFGKSFGEAVRDIIPQLKSGEKVTEILTVMEQVLDNTADFDRHYESMHKSYEDLKSYHAGTFNLFPNLPERKTQKPSDYVQAQGEVFDDEKTEMDVIENEQIKIHTDNELQDEIDVICHVLTLHARRQREKTSP